MGDYEEKDDHERNVADVVTGEGLTQPYRQFACFD